MKKKFETKYGYFSKDGNEYVIKTPFTPKPWVNVISNGDYGLVISQTGGGFSWQTHSEFNRINRWHQDLIQDNWGKYIYIRNNKTGKFWSPTFLPAKVKLDKYKCKHGIGYTAFESEYKGIKTQLTIFVPMDANLEIWDLKISNQSSKDADLSLFTYFEWCLGSSSDHHREFHRSFLETEFSKNENTMFATKRLWEIPLGDRGHWNIDYQNYGFLSCNKKISDYETDKEFFIGQYGDLINPAALSKKKLSKQTGKWIDPIGCIRIDLKIKKNKSENVAFYLGLVNDKSDAKKIIKKFKTSSQIESALEKVKNTWSDILGSLEIDTPDEGMNILVNKWLRYQAISGRLWGRTAYYQQSGAFGFRDQLQDSLVFLPINSKLTENQIRLHAKHQFEDGTVLHWWHPITDTGLATKMTDDLLWLPFLMIHHHMETGNISFFDETSEFYDNRNLVTSLYDHCIRAIERVLVRMSGRGLPLIGAGDWNDGLSAVGLEWKGESIWLAEFLFYILTEFQKIAVLKNDSVRFEKLKIAADQLRSNFEKYAWDGEWFFGATKDSGEKIGSKENKEGRIYLNSQTWAVISQITGEEKQIQAMDSVKKLLIKKNGPLLLFPAYKKPDKYIGYLSRYAAGRRENGGVYMHAATWAIWAFAELKEAKNAYQVYQKISPVNNGMNPDEYFAEPYVTPGNIEGPESPQYGRGGWTWYTGSAAWLQKVVVDWILGVRASEEGLIIDPCIPKEWKGFTVKRRFRNTLYNITVHNENHVSNGVEKVEVDGVSQETNIIRPNKKKSSTVKVYMG